MPKILYKPNYGNSHLEMEVWQLGYAPRYTYGELQNYNKRFCLHMKDYKWGRKWIFKNLVSRAFWAIAWHRSLKWDCIKIILMEHKIRIYLCLKSYDNLAILNNCFAHLNEQFRLCVVNEFLWDSVASVLQSSARFCKIL